MTSVRTVVERCRRRLYAQGRGRYNFLASAIDADDASLTLADELVDIQTGGILGIDSEILLVRPSIDKNAKTVPIARGFFGTTAAAHDSGAMVEISPRFAVGDILDTIVEEINSWGTQLFTVETTTINAVSRTRTYDITGATDFLFGLQLEADPSANLGLNDAARSSKPYRVVRDQTAGNFASTFALQLERDLGSSVTLRFTWARKFQTSAITLDSALEADVGLRASMIDLLVIGVCWRLMSTRDIPRTDMHASGETARAQDNPPGFSAATASRLLAIRAQRMADEANKLRAEYPFRVAG